jgi:hypothetical protein
MAPPAVALPLPPGGELANGPFQKTYKDDRNTLPPLQLPRAPAGARAATWRVARVVATEGVCVVPWTPYVFFREFGADGTPLSQGLAVRAYPHTLRVDKGPFDHLRDALVEWTRGDAASVRTLPGTAAAHPTLRVPPGARYEAELKTTNWWRDAVLCTTYADPAHAARLEAFHLTTGAVGLVGGDGRPLAIPRNIPVALVASTHPVAPGPGAPDTWTARLVPVYPGGEAGGEAGTVYAFLEPV